MQLSQSFAAKQCSVQNGHKGGIWSSDPHYICAFDPLLPSVLYSSAVVHWQRVGGGLNMVPKCWLARTLEVMGYSQSPVSGFCLFATFHRTLGKDHDMMTRHGTKKLNNAKEIAYLPNDFVVVIHTQVLGKMPSWEMVLSGLSVLTCPILLSSFKSSCPFSSKNYV